MTQRASGALVIIGGSEDREKDKVVLRRFADLAGGEDARIVVIGTATTVPDEVDGIYRDAFDDIGVASYEFLRLDSRDQANDEAIVAKVASATGVFFTGGDQLRIASILGGSKTDTALHSCFENGLVLAGTSAGAAMMSSTMIYAGQDTMPTADTVKTGAGLGFVSGMVIDMHFAERGRLSRLLAVVTQFPHEVGLGIDEDTAAIVRGTRFEVVGSGAVTVVDAGAITSLHTPPPGEEGPIAVTGVLLHVLPSGYEFDLSTRLPVILATPANSEARHDGAA